MTATRVIAARQLLKEQQLDALIFFGLPNIRYLCGFTGTDGVLFITAEETVFLTDSRYQTQANVQVVADKIICYQNKFSGLADLLSQTTSRRVGFDAEALTVAVYEELRQQGHKGMEWLPLTAQLRSLRAVKSPVELASLRRAAKLNRKAFEQVLPAIRPGVTERQIALELEFALKRLGGEVNAFDFIVASGERGALPHGVASDKALMAGELVTIDFGTRVAGYYSDETVTLALGEVDRNLRQIFDIVLKAHDLALDAIVPGLAIRDLDAVARDYIVAQGFGEYFGHGLGHGVGLEIHEYPAVSMRTDASLREGMVLTIEPGIYIPETGGVRIEDTIVVTAAGYETLTGIPKQFRQLAVV